MFVPAGFERHSTVTALGTVAYYSAEADFYGAAARSRTLVFIHGLGAGSSAYEWSKVYPAFAATYRVVAPDLIGWGRSDRPERGYSAEDYTRCIVEFIEGVCTPPVVAIASSLSGGFAVRAAVERPELFEALILSNPTGLSDFGDDYSRNFLAQLASVPLLDRWLYSGAIATSSGIAAFLEQRQFAKGDRIYGELVEAYLASAEQPNAECAALSFVRGDACFDLSLFLPQLRRPAGIIWGAQAQFTSVETGKRLAALNSEFVRHFTLLEDVGLTPHLELPAVTTGLIGAYLRELQSDR